MTGAQKTLTFLNSFGTGIFAPVLTLFILSRGCDIQNLSLIIGAYSATVIAAEVPSGMFADIYGRKRAFYLSCLFVAASFVLMYFASGFLPLAAGIVFFGLGRAFSSGSIESLIIEDCLHRGGDSSLAKVSGENLVLQSAGIAAGSLLGGFLPAGDGYILHIAVRISVLIAASALCAVFLKEEKIAPQQRKSMREQLFAVAGELRKKSLLRIVMLCIFGASITMFAVETYWQPRFSLLITEEQHYLLGIICALGYGGTTLGSFAAGKLPMSENKIRWRFYLLFAALYGSGMLLLSAQNTALGFMLVYGVTMTMLGFESVPEQTLLNSLAADETRASLLSVASLFSQLAGIAASGICAVIVLPLGVGGTMAIMGTLSVLTAAAAALVLRLQKNRV